MSKLEESAVFFWKWKNWKISFLVGPTRPLPTRHTLYYRRSHMADLVEWVHHHLEVLGSIPTLVQFWSTVKYSGYLSEYSVQFSLKGFLLLILTSKDIFLLLIWQWHCMPTINYFNHLIPQNITQIKNVHCVWKFEFK